MDSQESYLDPEKVCLGHVLKNRASNQCVGCIEDYNPNNYPNNYDCCYFKRFLRIYKEFSRLREERRIKINEETLESIVECIFLAVIKNPNISAEEILNGLREEKKIKRDTEGFPLNIYAC